MLNPYQILFEKIFMVEIPSYLVDELNSVNQRGRYMSEDKGVDEALAQEKRMIGLKVPKMIDAYELGIPVSIENKADVREIYNAIEDHLAVIKEHELKKHSSLNRVSIDREEIIKLDRFASTLSLKYPGVIENDIRDNSVITKPQSLFADLLGIVNPDQKDLVGKVDMSEVINKD